MLNLKHCHALQLAGPLRPSHDRSTAIPKVLKHTGVTVVTEQAVLRCTTFVEGAAAFQCKKRRLAWPGVDIINQDRTASNSGWCGVE
jgi:hypothetical protein